MKVCTRCDIEKPLAMFSPNKGCVGGFSTHCKACQSEYHRRKRAENPEYVRAMERSRINRDAKRAACRKYYAENTEKRSAKERERYLLNSEDIKQASKEYRIANKARVYEWNGTRRARLRNAMPAWADRDEIAGIYAQAALKQAETNVPHHVDHFYPLSGKTVCGLHVPANLRIVTATENLRKGAKCF